MPTLRTLSVLVLATFSALATAFADKPLVVTTTTILADFAHTLGDDAVEVRCLLAAGRDPHSFQPTPADVRLLARADLVIVNGLGFETWFAKLIQNSGFRGPTVTASDGVKPLEVEHDHSAHDHDHDHDHGLLDPHAWHDLRLARHYVENIRNALSRLAPAEADAIKARAETYLGELAALDRQTRERFAAIPEGRRTIVTSHDSLRYLGEAYGLKIIPLTGLNPEREPSARQLAALIKVIRAENVRAIFIESTTNPKIPGLLARETGISVVTELYTDSLGDAGSPGATFLGMFRANIDTIERSLR